MPIALGESFIHPGKIKWGLLTVWTEKRRFIEIGRVIG